MPKKTETEQPDAKRTLVPRGKDDNVMTPPEVIRTVMAHYGPVLHGSVLDACYGAGAYHDAVMREKKQRGRESRITQVAWAELQLGVDFFNPAREFGIGDPDKGKRMILPEGQRFDWCFTNPPWSVILHWWRRGMDLADNVSYLGLVPGCFQKAKKRAFELGGFGLREIAYIETPPKPWPQTGFCLGQMWIQRGYLGPMQEVKLTPEY